MDVVNITELSKILLKCQENIDALFVQRFELKSMSQIMGQVVKEMTNIRDSMEGFQPVELLG